MEDDNSLKTKSQRLMQSLQKWSSNMSKRNNGSSYGTCANRVTSPSSTCISMVSDSEMSPSLQHNYPTPEDHPALTWSSVISILKVDDKTSLQYLIETHGKDATLFQKGGTRYETTLFRASKEARIDCLEMLLEPPLHSDIIDQPDCDGYSPFLIAVFQMLPQVIKMLIDKGCNVNSRINRGEHALHILVNNLKNDKRESLISDTLDLLLSEENWRSIDLDPINDDGKTPIEILAECIQPDNLESLKNKKIIWFMRRLYEKGASLSTKTKSGFTVQQILIEKRVLSAVKLKEFNLKYTRPWISQFYNLVIVDAKIDDIIDLLKDKENDKVKKAVDSWLGSKTILLYCVDASKIEAVNMLLGMGANPMKKSDGILPIHRAMARTNIKIVDLLISSMTISSKLDIQSITYQLFSRVLASSKPEALPDISKSLCLKRLFKSDVEINVNDKLDDKKLNRSVLHLAAAFNNQEAIGLLIEHGAYIGERQIKYGSDNGTVIPAIQMSTFDSALNNGITYLPPSPSQGSSEDHVENVLDQNYILKLDYSFLVPTYQEKSGNIENVNEVKALMDVKECPGQSKMLTHPLIQALLYVKWKKVYPFYMMNLCIYLFFVLLLSFFMYYVSDLREIKHQLEQNSTFVSPDYIEKVENSVTIIWSFLLVPTIYMILREVFQIKSIGLKSYINPRNIENMLEIFLIVIVFVLSFVPLNADLTRHISAWSVIFAWLEFVFILGRAPPLAIYVVMLRRVVVNYGKMVILYGSLFVAFAMSFSIILNTNHITEPSSIIFWKYLPKVIIMATGEFEYSNFAKNLPTNIFLMISSAMILMVFLFLMFLVLMNIMNGMAVSDTSEVMDDAMFHSLATRLDLIFLIESFLSSIICCLPFARRFLTNIHILTGPDNLPRLLVKVNEKDKSKRVIYGKDQIISVEKDPSSDIQNYLKLNNTTVRLLKERRIAILEERDEKNKIDPIEKLLKLLQEFQETQRNLENRD